MTVPGKGGKPRKIPTPEIMWQKFVEYKKTQNEYTRPVSMWDKDGLRFVTVNVPKKMPYTILGFTLFIDLDRETFYQRYCKNPLYANTCSKICRECEASMVRLCTDDTINPKLAPLLLGSYGYTTKQDVKSDAHVEGEIKYSWGADKDKDKEE